MRNTHEPEPLFTTIEGRCLILEMPPMTDEAAVQLSELLQRLTARSMSSTTSSSCELIASARRSAKGCTARGICSRRSLPFEDALEEGLNDELTF